MTSDKIQSPDDATVTTPPNQAPQSEQHHNNSDAIEAAAPEKAEGSTPSEQNGRILNLAHAEDSQDSPCGDKVALAQSVNEQAGMEESGSRIEESSVVKEKASAEMQMSGAEMEERLQEANSDQGGPERAQGRNMISLGAGSSGSVKSEEAAGTVVATSSELENRPPSPTEEESAKVSELPRDSMLPGEGKGDGDADVGADAVADAGAGAAVKEELVAQGGSAGTESQTAAEESKAAVERKEEDIIVFSAPLKVVGEGGDGELMLGDEPIGPPLTLRVLTREEELAEFELLNVEGNGEPPLKKIRLAEEECGSCCGLVRRSIESCAFEEAFQETNVPFRTSIEEGAHHVIRKKEANVKFGLAMWAAALQQMFFDAQFADDGCCGLDGGSGGNEGIGRSTVQSETEDSSSTVPPPPSEVKLEAQEGGGRGKSSAESGAEKSASLCLNEAQESELRAGLSYLERIGGHVASNGANEGSFAYKSGSSLTICGVEMYDAVNNLIVSVISRRGQQVGERVIDFLRQILSLGSAVIGLGLVVLTATTEISKPPGNILLLPPAAGTQQHMMRTAKTTATLTAISRFALNSPADLSSAAPPAPPPTVPSVLPPMVVRPPPAQPPIPSPFDIHLPPHPPQQRPQPRYPPPVAPPPAAAAPVVPAPSAFLRARLPPPSLAARFLAPARPAIPAQPFNPAALQPASLHQRPPTVINLWTDPRLLELPDWVISTLVDMVYRYDGHVIAAVDQCWYSCYGAQLNFRLFGFTGLHDVLANIPGVTLKQEGSEFWVQVNGALLQEAIRQKWPTPGSRPAAGGQLPAEVLEMVNWRARQMQTNLLLTAQGGVTRIPPRICARLLELVRLNEGSNIGHIQQQWRQINQSEQLDVAALGYTKFSDLLQDVPGVQIVKEGSTVTAHTTKAPCPLPPGVQAAAALKGVGGKTPYDHQQQIQMMRQMLQMQMHLATMASLQNGAR